MKEQIQIAAKLYQCHDAAKNLFKDEFQEKIKWYRGMIEGVRTAKGLDVLPAVLLICKDKAVQENGMAVMLFLAAAVEMEIRK